MKKIVFDIETQNTFQEVGSNDPAKLSISLVGVYDYATNSYSSYLENELHLLWPLLEQADIIIGYNSDHFDLPLINKYYGNQTGKAFSEQKSLDLMKEIKKSLGRRIGLGHVAQATLGKAKGGHGLEAITWWRNGEIEKIRTYCLEDVKITKELYEYALKNSAIKYPLGTRILDLKLDTSAWDKTGSSSSSSSATFTLPF